MLTTETSERSPAELLAAIAEALPAALAYIDAGERYRYVNRYYTQRFGKFGGKVGATVRDALGAEQYERIRPHIARALAGESVTFEGELRHADGEALWLSVTYVPDVGPEGRVLGYAALVEDITDRRRKLEADQRALAESNRVERQAHERISRLQEVTAALSRAQTADDVIEVACRLGSQAMEAVSGVIWLADDADRLVMAGSWDTAPQFIEQFGVLAPGDDRFPGMDMVRTGVPVYVETAEDWQRLAPGIYPIARARGRLASFAALPMASEAGIAGVIAFGHPLGHRYDGADRVFYATLAQHCQQALERARLLDEARAASAAAYRASRAKDEFLAMLGHELRNPLAPIVTALDLLQQRGTPGFERERAVIERQVQHLCRLVDDLLDVARITAGRIQLERAEVVLQDVVARSVEMVRPLIEERHHALAIKVEDGLRIDGDAMRLAQVVTNLLVNAAKYTPPGGRVEVLGARDGREIVLRVRDTGAGISAELLPRVFDLFQQGPQALHRPHGGLGLGLAIVKSLIALHGGTVSAHSDGPGRGSEFVVRLPGAERG